MSDSFRDDGPTDPFRTLDPDQRRVLHGEPTGDDLVAAVYADPGSDEPRLVYGDYLIEHEDPRGEFVQLQLARDGTGAPPSQREVELLAQHTAAWTDPLTEALHVDSIVFERGFLARCRAQDRMLALRDVIGHPMWLTVVELMSNDVSLVTHPCLRSLTRLTTSAEVLSRLAAVDHAVKVEHVEIEGYFREDDDDAPYRSRNDQGVWRQIEEVGALVALKSLALRTDATAGDPRVSELLRSKLGLQLVALELMDTRGRLAAWDAVLRNHSSLRRIAVRVGGRSDDNCGAAVIERDAHGECHAVLALEANYPAAGVMAALRKLPDTYRVVTIVNAPTHASSDDHSVLEGVKFQLSQRFDDVVVTQR